MSNKDNRLSLTETQAIKSTELLLGKSCKFMETSLVKRWLQDQVMDLLNTDFNALVNLLYRIDVYESKAKTCFGKQNRDIAICLADLIWERQMEKARRKNQG